jgi:CBS domain containing-hemolysin-like protein
MAPLLNFLMIALGILAYPISKILDYLLGEHTITRYNNNDLKGLIELHTMKALQALEDLPAQEDTGLRNAQVKMIEGAIDI